MATPPEETPEGAGNEAPAKPEGNEVEIIDIRTVPSTEPERAGKMDTLVTYQLDPQHVYMLRIQKEEASSEEIQEAVRDDFRGKQGVIGTSVSV